MSNSTYYGPVGETADEIFLEKTFLASGYLTALGYGIQLVLYGACVQILLQQKKRTPFRYFLIGYITVLCAMNTIWTGTSAYGLQLTFIDNRNYPDGPLGFLLVEFSLPVNVLSLASYIIGNILADALLLWRCRVIWIASLGKKVEFVMILPNMMLLASIAMAIVYTVETASPTVGFFSRVTVNFGIIFFAISLSLNIILTLMIVVRIWVFERHGRSILGDNLGKRRASISTIFVESAAMYAIISILLLATYSVGHPINQIFLGLSPSVQMIANYLIIYRVAQGRAWTSETFPVEVHANRTMPGAFGYGSGNSCTRIADDLETADLQLSQLKQDTDSQTRKFNR